MSASAQTRIYIAGISAELVVLQQCDGSQNEHIVVPVMLKVQIKDRLMNHGSIFEEILQTPGPRMYANYRVRGSNVFTPHSTFAKIIG